MEVRAASAKVSVEGEGSKQEKEGDDFDDLLNVMGLGRWTLLMFSSFICWGLVLPYFSLGSAFLNPNVDHWCKESDDPSTGEALGNSSVVWTRIGGRLKRSQCEEYDIEAMLSVNNTEWNNTSEAESSKQDKYGELFSLNTTNAPTKQCDQWEYDTSVFKSTVAMDWDLVCASAHLSPFFQSFYYIGITVGEPLLGYLSDKLGRRWVLRRIWFLFIAASVTSVVASNYSLLLAMRFLLGFVHAAASISYVMLLESCPARLRSPMGIGTGNFYAFSGIVFGGLAYFIRDWRLLQGVCILPGLLHLCYLPLLDESPRWLLQMGRPDEAKKVLLKASAWHHQGREEQDRVLQLLEQHYSKRSPAATSNSESQDWYQSARERTKLWLKELLILVKTPMMRRISLAMFGCFALVGFSFWGLSLSGGSFSSDPFLYIVISSIMEIFGYSWIIPLMSVVGRRTLLALNFAVSAVAMLAILTIPDENVWAIFLLAMTGKLFITAAYNLLYLYCAELFPTCVRSRGLNVSSMMARTASILSPFVVTLLASSYTWAPSFVFGIAAALGSLLALMLPESKGLPMLDTVEQLEKYYRPQSNAEQHVYDNPISNSPATNNISRS